MTGGRAVILGPTGRNFAAGMSGGIAYIWDPNDEFSPMCNTELVELERISDPTEAEEVRRLIANHARYTGSPVAENILSDWTVNSVRFIKVMPTDYKRVLQSRGASKAPLDLAAAGG